MRVLLRSLICLRRVFKTLTLGRLSKNNGYCSRRRVDRGESLCL